MSTEAFSRDPFLDPDVSDLAIFGGPPTFESPVLVGRPNIGNRGDLHRRIDEVLDSKWLTNCGRMSVEFERRVAEVAGTEYAIATCNATSALQLALRASGATGEVIVPSFTFAATAHAVAWLGLTPVLCDVDPSTGSMNLDEMESLIGPNTSAVLAVHIWGMPRAVRELEAVTRARGIALLFDSAHAFGCTYDGVPVGGFGDAEVFSFHSTKFINSFEGGALVTDDPEIAAAASRMRNFGISGQDNVSDVGINAKMSEAAAAMGLTSLDSMGTFVDHNRAVYDAYRDGLAEVCGMNLIAHDETESNNWQYVVLDIDDRVVGLNRDQVVDVLSQENIVARRYFYPGCHRMEPYRTTRRFPGTDHIASRVLVLPTGENVTTEDVVRICSVLSFVAERGYDIADRLRTRAALRRFPRLARSAAAQTGDESP